MKKLKVGILGATGMVGQRFIQLLESHPWFEIAVVAASLQSAGKRYENAVLGRWKMEIPIPERVKKLKVKSVEGDMKSIAQQVDFVFSCLDMDKEDIKRTEEAYASINVPVVSNNSAHRWTKDVPMIMPEINPDHLKLIGLQRKNRGWGKGFIAVKPNCSIQSFVSILTALRRFKPTKVQVVSMQAISGAGKIFDDWPEMVDNVIPLIVGEEEKSENEPLRIWGNITNGKLQVAKSPNISAVCVRVPVSNGHMASISVSFMIKPSRRQILAAIHNFQNPIARLHLPSAPKEFIHYFDEENRPHTNMDCDFERGMGITMGRLHEGKHFDWKFVALSHNTIRGAAGGAILMAELLVKKGYI